MQLSIEKQSWEDFSGKAFASFADDATHIYIDTSFLMWLTKIGPKSFEQFKAWLKATSNGRIHIPVWAGHEYANHHVAGTLADELSAAAGELSAVAASAYAKLRPFLDADLVVGKSPEAQQVQLRTTLSALEAAAAHCRLWTKQQYADRTQAVMAFITEYSLQNTPVFDLMNAFPALGIARFDGRIPPGFKDRGKKERTREDADVVEGSNKYGDLIFWREILDHAKSVHAKHLVLLTKDGKNDWVFGGGTQPTDEVLRDMGRTWKPLPIPHPMLAVEARNTAGVEGLSLIDSAYLGAMLRHHGVADVAAFVDVAVVPDPPKPIDEQKAAKRRALEALPPNQRPKKQSNVLFLDGSNVASTPNALRIAVNQCRSEPSAGSALGLLVQQMKDLVASGDGISELFTEQHFKDRTTNELAAFGRTVHALVLSQATPEYTEAGADLIAALEKLPEKTGGALLLGILVAMYLPTSIECRLPATSPLLAEIYKASQLPFAKTACEVIGEMIDKKEMRPLFRPVGSAMLIDAKFEIDDTNLDEDSLASLSICGEAVLTDQQFAKNLNLRALSNGASHLNGAEILGLAGRILGIPIEAIKRDADAERPYFISDSIGFKSPQSVFIEGQESKA